MNTKKIHQYILKLKDSFLEETDENKRMLDIYVRYIEGVATDEEIDDGLILTCQAMPTSNSIIIDYDDV